MKIDTTLIHRNLEDITKDDVIFKKNKVKEVLKNDPDIEAALNRPSPRPILPKMTDKQKEEAKEYNKKISKPQIIDYVKLNDLQTDVLNYVMFDIFTERGSYNNQAFQSQYLDIFCVVNESDIETEYSFNRADWLAYIVKDLFNQSSGLGKRMTLYYDQPNIMDNQYYYRELRFRMDALDTNRTGVNRGNYDNFTQL